MHQKEIVLGIFAFLLLLPLVSNSEAKLWDLQIQANMEKSPIISGERPIVAGIIVDHASKPVPEAEVTIKSEDMSIITKTSKSGEFRIELGKHERTPGNYIVTILASTPEGKTGIVSIMYQVKGELSASTVNNQKLSTPEAKKYLNASPDDFEKNPIGLVLYNYYQKLYKEYLSDVEIDKKISETNAQIKERQDESFDLRQKAIDEYNPGAGIFSGPDYENYVNSLEPKIRETVVQHLEFTKNLFYEAQAVKNEILENGGTVEEAQQAYLEKISTTREMIESLGEEQSNSISEEVNGVNNVTKATLEVELDPEFQTTQTSKQNDEHEEISSPIFVNVDGTLVQVDYTDSIFFVEVNGVLLQFILEDGHLTRINSE